MPCASEISRMRTGGSPARCRARARTARQAYSAFAEIFMRSGIPEALTRSGSKSGRRGPDRGRRSGASKLTAVERMQPAFGLRLARPAAGPFVLAGADGPRAGPAADRGKALVVERVVGDMV